MTASDYAAITIASSATQVDSSFNLVRGNTITGGNTVTGTEGQISIFGNAHRNRINANTLVNSGSHGIVVHGSLSGDASQAGNNEISNNIVNGADKHGIYLAGTAGTSVVGNRVHEASGESAGTYNAYSIGPDTVTATADTGATFIANRASDSSSTRAAFNIDSSAPTPTSLTLYANHFPELSGGFAISNSGNVVYRQDGQLPNIVGTFTAADATPNIATARYWQTADTTTYTAFDGGIQGDLVYIIFKHTAAIDFTQATLNGNGGVSWTARVGDMAIGVNVDGTNWYFNIVTLDTDT
jgi:parallel beta-helix repeat protein